MAHGLPEMDYLSAYVDVYAEWLEAMVMQHRGWDNTPSILFAETDIPNILFAEAAA